MPKPGMTALRRLLLAVLMSVPMLAARAQGQAPDRPFQFGLVGDMPYSKIEEQEFDRVIAQMNARDLAFVIHIGDMQNDPRPHNQNTAGSAVPCTDAMNDWLLARFQTIRHPFVMTPGDNDWTDCHLLRSQKVDPLERLEALRKKFYPEGRSLGGRTMPVESQSADPQHSKFKENLRWSIGGVTFVTLHITGSNDNAGRAPEMDAEQKQRKAANLVWLKQAFARARAETAAAS